MKSNYIPFRYILSILGILFIGVSSCALASASDIEPDNWPTQAWESSTPEAQGVDSAQLVEMFEYIEENEINLHSLLIVRNGYIITEAYWHPYSPDDVHTIESITKSVIGSLIGIAIDRGEIENVEQSLLDILGDRDIKNLDEDKRSITLSNLLSMTPGLDCADTKVIGHLGKTTNWVQYLLDLPMSSKPGTNWVYCSGASHLLSAVLQVETGLDARTYANQYLFKPLGIPKATKKNWASDPQGIVNGIAGLYLTPRDLAKYGYLYLNRGNWDGEQVMSSGWVEESTREQAFIGEDDYVGGLDRRFGYLWSIFPDLNYYGYLGMAGQGLFILPQESMVVVITGGLRVGEESSMLDLVNDYIVPSIRSEGSIIPNKTANAELESHIREAEGSREPVPSFPATAFDISGMTYQLDINSLGWRDMTFYFESGSDEAVLTMTKSPDLKIGLDNRYRITEIPGSRPTGLRGYWSSTDTFYLDYIVLGDFIHSEAWIKFEGDEINVTINYLNWQNPPIVIQGTN